MDSETGPCPPGRTAVRLSDPGEVAAGLPHLLGFNPAESVVLIGLGGESGNRVGLTLRADLPPPAAAAALGRRLVHGVLTDDPAAALVAVVSEAPDQPGTGGDPDLPHRGLVGSLLLALTERCVPMREALLVRGGRWWSYECPHACCRPGVGTPLPAGVSELEAASVVEGRVLARDRDELVARLARPDGGAAVRMADVGLQIGHEYAAGLRGRHAAAVGDESWAAITNALARLRSRRPVRLTDAEVARIAWGLQDQAVRDHALVLALGPDADAAELLWLECARRSPEPLDAVPATLLAVSAWLGGDGASAAIALARARASDPDYELARLLEGALAGFLSPTALRDMIADGLERNGPP